MGSRIKRTTPLLLAQVMAFALTCPALVAETPDGTVPIRPTALYPTEDFERESYRYILLDVTRQDTPRAKPGSTPRRSRWTAAPRA